MSYIPRMRESSAGWLGQGQFVYSTPAQANTPFANNPTLQQLQKPYKDAQTQRRASQAADKALRQASRQGNVTVYDAVKRQYVSATPAEAKAIQSANRELQTQRRFAQTKQLGKGNVTIFDASKGLHVSATPQEAKLIEKANKRLAAINGLNERITAQMGNKSKYGGKTVKVGDKYVAQSQLETAKQSIQQEYIRKIGQIEKQHTQRVLQRKTSLSPSIIDNNLGLDRTPKSAQESMGVFVKREVEQALSQKTPLNPSIIDNNLGLDRTPKSVQESASAFIEHGLTDTEKALEKTTKESKGILGSIKGLFGKAKNVISNGLNKFKAFSKTPKGKWTFAITALIIAGTALYAYVANRFSDKNNPAPTNGPDRIFMPKLVDETKEDTDIETDKTEKIRKEAEEKEEADKVAKANENKREPEKVSGDEYEVVDGDCVWNIAKAHLKELNNDIENYVPSNVDILRHTKKLMEINDLHYEADNYVVIIQPGQKLKLK